MRWRSFGRRERDVDAAPVRRSDVVAAYRLLLGRSPDLDDDLHHHLHAHQTVGQLRRAMLDSAEFRLKEGVEALPPVWVCAETGPDGRRIWLNLADKYVSVPCLHGRYEPAETAFLQRWTPAGALALDVGANIGWHTLALANAVGPQGRVYAFEPRRDLQPWLARTLADNDLVDRVSVDGHALSDAVGVVRMSWRPTSHNPGHTWMEKAGEPQATGVESMEVPAARLDSLALPGAVAVLKIDIEGAEHRALLGGAALLRNHGPLILTEVYPEQLEKVSGVEAGAYLALLRGAGYACHRLGEDGAVLDEVQNARALPFDRPTSIVARRPGQAGRPAAAGVSANA